MDAAPNTWLELDLTGDTIAGLIHEGGHAEPFSGWLELVAAIEDTRARQRPEPHPARGPGPAWPEGAVEP